MDMALKIEPANFNSYDYFAFVGKIDANAEAQLMELPLKIRQPLVKLDFRKTLRIDSMGISLLLRCLKTIKEEKKADIRLIQPNPMNTMLFKMTGVLLLAKLDA
jgi:anti-anti-sigma regulatory factor